MIKYMTMTLIVLLVCPYAYADNEVINRYYNLAMDRQDQKLYNDSFRMLYDLCKNNKPMYACFYLADHYINGAGVNQDFEKALKIYDEIS